MPLYRRAGSPHWWVRISVAGVKVRKTTGTDSRTDAEEFEHREHDRLWRLHKLGDRSAALWSEAAKRWLSETTKRSKVKDEIIIAWLEPHIGDEPLSAIDRDAIEVLRKQLLKEGRAQATVNRYMCLVRSILRKCEREWKILDRAPVVPMYKLEDAELRWLTHDEWDRLKKELPPHLALAAQFAVLTGLRMRAMLMLTWDRIDLDAKRLWVKGSQQKAGRAHGIPISTEAVGVLKALRKLNPDGQNVFQWKGKPIDDCNTLAFQKALARAKIEGANWHSLRHTFASWAVQAGVTLQELMGLGDWKSYEMVLRYAHLAPDHLASAASKVGTNRAQRKTRNVRKP
jgi:integrase